MSKYSNKYQMTHDIDWFATINGIHFHFASNGGKLPDGISSESNAHIQRLVESLNPQLDVEISESVNTLFYNLTIEERENYLHSFEEMAKKGFISCDNINDETFDNPHYKVITFPSHGNGPDLSNQMVPELDILSLGFSEEDLSLINRIK